LYIQLLNGWVDTTSTYLAPTPQFSSAFYVPKPWRLDMYSMVLYLIFTFCHLQTLITHSHNMIVQNYITYFQENILYTDRFIILLLIVIQVQECSLGVNNDFSCLWFNSASNVSNTVWCPIDSLLFLHAPSSALPSPTLGEPL